LESLSAVKGKIFLGLLKRFLISLFKLLILIFQIDLLRIIFKSASNRISVNEKKNKSEPIADLEVHFGFQMELKLEFG